MGIRTRVETMGTLTTTRTRIIPSRTTTETVEETTCHRVVPRRFVCYDVGRRTFVLLCALGRLKWSANISTPYCGLFRTIAPMPWPVYTDWKETTTRSRNINEKCFPGSRKRHIYSLPAFGGVDSVMLLQIDNLKVAAEANHKFLCNIWQDQSLQDNHPFGHVMSPLRHGIPASLQRHSEDPSRKAGTDIAPPSCALRADHEEKLRSPHRPPP